MATATRPAGLPYSAPGAAWRAVSFASTAGALGAVQIGPSAGKTLSESAFGASGGTVLGAPGLTGVQTLAVSATGGRPGLAQGLATGLSFGSPVNNIFRARFNPATGPGGRCHELAGAGFFAGNRTICEHHFRRR
jgi:hypothetical protein